MSGLEAIELAKSYGRRKVVVNVSLSLQAGQILALLGPNGAGKTTIFSMIIGSVRPDSGSIFIDGTELTRAPIARRARAGLGYLAQGNSVFRALSVSDNLLAVLEFRRDLRRDARGKICAELLEEFGLAHLAKARAQGLSGGERRRLEIARALATQPKFLLMDEPFAGVDPIAIGEMKKMAVRLAKRGLGILITDHNARAALALCDTALVIKDGQLVAAGDREEIIANHEVRAAYLGDSFLT